MNTKATQLDHNITQLRTRLLVMAAAVGIALDEACGALKSGNVGQAIAVIDGDLNVNELENEIDALALALLVRNQPVAQDLRFVIAILRIVVDLERIGDISASICKRIILMHETLPTDVFNAVSLLIQSATGMYKRAIQAFREGNSELALQVCQEDEESSQMETTSLHQIMDYLCANDLMGKPINEITEIVSSIQKGGGVSTGFSDKMYAGMHGILICHEFSRICRRANKIAEQTYFIVEGVNIKHRSMEEVTEETSDK